MEQFRNPGTNTYDGVKAMAALTGLSASELAWMARRTQELIRSGMSREETKVTVLAEGKSRPWEAPHA